MGGCNQAGSGGGEQDESLSEKPRRLCPHRRSVTPLEAEVATDEPQTAADHLP